METVKSVMPIYMQDGPNIRDALRRDIADVLNRHSIENMSNTPDFILADYLIACLEAWSNGVQTRAKWYGRHDSPGSHLG